MKIGRRNIGIFLARSFSVQNWKAMTMFKKVHTEPLKSIYQELFSVGKYPRLIKFKSPTGLHEVKLYSPNDFSTFNLIFCRQDYFTTNNFKTVVDIGSNIGISAVFWLTRYYQSKVYCYEPSSANYKIRATLNGKQIDQSVCQFTTRGTNVRWEVAFLKEVLFR